MKTVSYTYEQIAGIVNNLNRIQVMGLEQARILAMVGVLLDEGVQSEIPDGEAAGGDGTPGETVCVDGSADGTGMPAETCDKDGGK